MIPDLEETAVPIEAKKITASDIQQMICKMEVMRYNLPAENVKYLISDWELDVISLNKRNYLTEYEIKLTRSDFKADFKKKKWRIFSNPNGFLKCANYFYYVCPENLIKVDELPPFAGLIYFNKGIGVIKKAPIIHRHKWDRSKVLSKLMSVMTERKYLGCARLTLENNLIKERNANRL